MSLADRLPLPDVYYDPWTSGKAYFVRNDRKNFIPITEGNLKRMLKEQGHSSVVPPTDTSSPLDKLMSRIQTEKDVDYSGPLAGYETGMSEIMGRRILVTDSPRFIEAKQGPWPTIQAFLDGLLAPSAELDADGKVGKVQLETLYSWLQVACGSLRAFKRRPGQALVIAGPANCGKSLLQNLITRLLGGRSSNPYQYMIGGTQFNSELFQAEHLMIEDEAASFDHRVRRHFGRQLNAFLVNETHRCHGKNRVALTLKPWWRVSITLNDEAENLMVLPPIDESLTTKFHLLRAFAKPIPMPTETQDQRDAFERVLLSELPAFLDFVLNQWRIPQNMMCGRYGAVHYHHPELLAMMSVLSHEATLLELIDSVLWDRDSPIWSEWIGRASELEAKLCAPASNRAHEARKLFTWAAACGVYLGRLERLRPERISSKTVKGYTVWEIAPPPKV